MSIPSRVAVALAGLTFAVAACGGTSNGASTDGAATADAAPVAFPQFSAQTSDGGQLEFGSLEGQNVVIWFWAPW